MSEIIYISGHHQTPIASTAFASQNAAIEIDFNSFYQQILKPDYFVYLGIQVGLVDISANDKLIPQEFLSWITPINTLRNPQDFNFNLNPNLINANTTIDREKTDFLMLNNHLKDWQGKVSAMKNFKINLYFSINGVWGLAGDLVDIKFNLGFTRK